MHNEEGQAGPSAPRDDPVDLLVERARAVITMDGTELDDAWVAVRGNLIEAIGVHEPPKARRVLSASGCVVTPGFVNTHHHLFQNLTRAYAPATQSTLFGWLSTLYPLWSHLDEEAIYLSTLVGLAELALGGCTTTTDHLYVHPHGAGDLLGAEIRAAQEFGLRFHPTRGSMSASVEEGGLPPRTVVEDEDDILAACEDAVARHHDPSFGAMVRIALAPCSPFSVTPRLMREVAELAERLDVRLHTHLAEDQDEDLYCLEHHGCRPVELFDEVGWASDRSWVAHCVFPNEAEIAFLGERGVGIAHCPSSNLMLAAGLAPISELRRAGCAVGLGCDGSSSTDSASLWLEARMAMLLARLRGGPASTGARDALGFATTGGAACLGRQGELGVLRPGAVADLVCWPLEGVAFAGAWSDPAEALLRCGPVGARHTVVNGRPVVEDGRVVGIDLDDVLERHAVIARSLQGRTGTA